MKRRFLTLLLPVLAALGAQAQTTCNSNANLVIFTNYDGGVLNINVDVNIPNLKIAVCSYEAMTINLSGTYVGNVTAVRYAGYNSANSTHCGPAIATTTINGAPSTATTSITFAPPAPLSNSNGYGSIICGYTCSTTTNQGGCNTIDQIEAYFLAQFSGSVVRMHKVQYGCWSGTYAVSGGGTCCLTTTPNPLAVSTSTTTPITCYNGCNGTVTATATGGQSPYTYQWSGGPATANWTNRCAGTYSVTVTDAANATATQSVTLSQPALINTPLTQTACRGFVFNGANRTSSGTYLDTLVSSKGCDSILTLSLTINNANKTVNQTGSTLTAAAAGATYKWVNCDSNYKAIPGATGQTFVAPKNGHYALIITQNGCTDTSACKTVTGVGIREMAGAAAFKVFPNPVNDVITIEAGAALLNKGWELTDETGKRVLEGKISHLKTPVSLRTLPAGLYLLRIEGAGEPLKVKKQ